VGDWFMGRTEGLLGNKTTRIARNDLERTPYRTFFKWRAEVHPAK
jgi:hypothetical protein